MKVSTEWQPIWTYTDPPKAPDGYEVEVERDSMFGLVMSYRYVKKKK